MLWSTIGPPVPVPLFAGVPPKPFGPAGPVGDALSASVDAPPLALRVTALFTLFIWASIDKGGATSKENDDSVRRTGQKGKLYFYYITL